MTKLILVLTLTPLPSAEAAGARELTPSLEAVLFESPGGVAADGPAPVGRYDVVALVEGGTAPSEKYHLLTSIELIAAPRHIAEELHGRDVVDSVSWGILTTMDNLGAQVIQIAPDTSARYVVLPLEVQQIVHASFPEPGELWPWAFRATVRLVDRYGVVVSKASAILNVPPPGDVKDAAFVMTSWHDGESPDDVAFFFVLNTNFDAHDFRRYLVLHVGAGPAQDQVDAAVRKYALNENAV